MNRDAMEKWVGALENGDYKQCFGRLRMVVDPWGTRFCALGVGYEVMAQDLGVKDWFSDSEMGPKFLDWLGFDSFHYLTVHSDRGKDCVTSLNDWDKLTFPEIAQLLRKEYL